MPRTNKQKTTKNFLIDILREPYVTKEDANILFDRIREEVIRALMEGKVVNLFDLVTVKAIHRVGHLKLNAFGESDLLVPDRNVLKAKVYPRLKREYSQIVKEGN